VEILGGQKAYCPKPRVECGAGLVVWSLYFYVILPPSIYLLHLSKILFSKNLLRISLGPRVWLLVHAAHLVLIGCSLSAFIAPWLFIGCDSLATPCLKCKLASFYCSLVIAPKANTMETYGRSSF